MQKRLKSFIRQIRVHPRPIPLLVFLLCGLYFFVIVATAGDMGWTWDEVYYFLSSQMQIAWFDALVSASSFSDIRLVLSKDFVDAHWLWNTYHNPHPPLYKIFSSISWLLLGNTLGDFTAYRLSSALFAAVLLFFLFRAIDKNHGFLPALCGSLTLFLMPRFFGHSHIAATEIPLAALWFMTCYLFYSGLTNRWSVLAAGIVLGCAFAVKFTAVLIPVPLVLWALIYREKKAFGILAVMLIIAPVIAVLVNPGWWHSPVDKIYEFVSQSLGRKETIPIATYFMGKRWIFSPPWFYAPVMLLITIPLTALLAIAAGLVSLAREKFCSASDVLYLLNIPVIMGVVMLPGTPVHDGIRQFFYVLPFLAYLSGPGYGFIINTIRSLDGSRTAKTIAAGVCLFMLLFPQVWQLNKYHPYHLSYYNGLIGGLYGAYNRGMEITYWFDAFDDRFIHYINTHIEPPAKIGVFPSNITYFNFLQSMGKIKDGIVFCGPEKLSSGNDETTAEGIESREYFILMSRLAAFGEMHWFIFKNIEPLYATRVDGVQLMGIYEW